MADRQKRILKRYTAHPFLPKGAQGATQALEDSVTIAICRRSAGEDHIQSTTRAFQEIRYERVRDVHKTGQTTRDFLLTVLQLWHKADWDKVAENPESIAVLREDWVHGHDAKAHAEEVVQTVLIKLINGKHADSAALRDFKETPLGKATLEPVTSP
ncbi:hypothetical protein NU219Hw_g4997t1 [Hortaea werneckii]